MAHLKKAEVMGLDNKGRRPSSTLTPMHLRRHSNFIGQTRKTLCPKEWSRL
jgi:hypothetical protein